MIDKNEHSVLSLVRKYPFYSPEKLAKELPGVSPHSIKRILEKNKLEIIEKRLEFSANKKIGLLLLFKGVKMRILGFLRKKKFKFNIERFKKLFKNLQEHPRSNWQMTKNLAILGGLALIFWYATNFILAKPPDITLNQPSTGFINKGEKLFVSGKVVPRGSPVTVNGERVALNGDGSFTAVINIPAGESVLEIEAVNRGKKSSVLRLVKRELTSEELQARQEEEEKKKKEVADRVAGIERTVNDLLAAKNASANKKGLLRVVNNHVKEEAGFFSVVGEVVNFGSEDVSWVMITAKFYNQSGSVVDTKYGFATDFDEVIKPGGKAEFETQATRKEFDHYSLEISWEEVKVGGVATEAAGLEKPAETQPSTP